MRTGLSPATGPRDERLDFFRGITMLIIFIAHVPGNSWNGFIPARFGFSSGAELFVFCSGLASAIAFGGTFGRHGMSIGTARIAYRMWQVYWAQICLVVALIGLAAISDALFGLNALHAQFGPLLTAPAQAILGLVTLTWQPDYLDILPVYFALLALVPIMIWLRRLDVRLPFALTLMLYAAAWSAGFNFSGNPWTGAGWFFNPFAWQAIFFIGFFVGMRWLPVPRLGDPILIAACLVFIVASVPVSFWPILERWPEAQAVHDALLGAHEKTNLHPLRIFHFLALAYVVVSFVNPWRQTLTAGLGARLVLIGQQSLATFLASIVLARLGASVAQFAGQSEIVTAEINLAGFASLYAVAVAARWFKRSPWKAPAQATQPEHHPRHVSLGHTCPTCALMRSAN